jgi:hypothetical protein
MILPGALRVLNLQRRRSLLTADISSAAFYELCDRMAAAPFALVVPLTKSSPFKSHIVALCWQQRFMGNGPQTPQRGKAGTSLLWSCRRQA